MIDTGFSSAILSIGAPIRAFTNSSASCCSLRLSLNHRAPDTAKCVHGGCAIISPILDRERPEHRLECAARLRPLGADHTSTHHDLGL